MDHKTRPRIGLALGSGGARGMAHVGVLHVLEAHHIPIDYIAGSSMGSLVGALYASGYNAAELDQIANLFKRKFYLDFTVPKMGLMNGKRIEELIYMLTKGQRFDELERPLTVTATNLQTGAPVQLNEGNVAKAVRASISIPGIFVPVEHEQQMLVDGGIVDRVPAQVVRQMGADIVIAVDVSYFPKQPPISSIYDVIMQSMEIMGKEVLEARTILADVLMRPIVRQHSSVMFQDTPELIKQGKEEAEKYVSLIKERMTEWEAANE
ncbi:serine protease [Geomicrobium sp. JCM 19037]|uniref:patatin-like phospholipase family protein n=1 Tax=Geomicrobium sp. JCM 19037 TaxID=1460634 RepID=UPI00045F3D47|nr:patatin-like phospholipase family protein [Geomicrobium sp. JCM 19037]GAK04067.1 serine protease [Geomicrobium sp. JCM 19037]